MIDVATRKEKLIKMVKELRNKGMSFTKISEELMIDRRTVKKYSEYDGTWINPSKGVQRESILDEYKDIVKKMHIDGYTSNIIHEYIKVKGYNGSPSLIRTYISYIRNEIVEDKDIQEIEYVKRETLTSLLYNSVEKVKNITYEKLEKLLNKFEELKKILV